jgi:hypothetical protein
VILRGAVRLGRALVLVFHEAEVALGAPPANVDGLLAAEILFLGCTLKAFLLVFLDTASPDTVFPDSRAAVERFRKIAAEEAGEIQEAGAEEDAMVRL